MKKIAFFLVFFSLMFGCKTSTSPSDPVDPIGFSRVSPGEFFRIYAHSYGVVHDSHLSEADEFWTAVSQCMSIDMNRINVYSILLEDSTNFACGEKTAAGCYFHDSRDVERLSHISVLGGPELIAPEDQNYPSEFRILEYKRIWRHEMVHLGFAMRGEDWDHENGSSLWACQCPPEYKDCFNWEQNIQRMESIRTFR